MFNGEKERERGEKERERGEGERRDKRGRKERREREGERREREGKHDCPSLITPCKVMDDALMCDCKLWEFWGVEVRIGGSRGFTH